MKTFLSVCWGWVVSCLDWTCGEVSCWRNVVTDQCQVEWTHLVLGTLGTGCVRNRLQPAPHHSHFTFHTELWSRHVDHWISDKTLISDNNLLSQGPTQSGQVLWPWYWWYSATGADKITETSWLKSDGLWPTRRSNHYCWAGYPSLSCPTPCCSTRSQVDTHSQTFFNLGSRRANQSQLVSAATDQSELALTGRLGSWGKKTRS